jgi:hypothetical protein
MFKIATWNVNSIRMRLEQVLGWLVDYRAAFAGESTYNGMALLSKPRSSLRDSAVSR